MAASSQRGVVLALTNACLCRIYAGGRDGVRLIRNGAGLYAMVIFSQRRLPVLRAMIARREASRYLAQQWKKGILAGLALYKGSYGLPALWV